MTTGAQDLESKFVSKMLLDPPFPDGQAGKLTWLRKTVRDERKDIQNSVSISVFSPFTIFWDGHTDGAKNSMRVIVMNWFTQNFGLFLMQKFIFLVA